MPLSFLELAQHPEDLLGDYLPTLIVGVQLIGEVLATEAFDWKSHHVAASLLRLRSTCGRPCRGVVDGSSPKGVEGEDDITRRKGFLRLIGYKL